MVVNASSDWGRVMKNRWVHRSALLVAALLLISAGACARRQPPVARPAPPTEASPRTPGEKPPPPKPVPDEPPVPPEPVPIDELATKSLDELNRDSPLGPVFFDYDSAELTSEGRTQLARNAEILKQRLTWAITIEGHCDERGTAEYNLALGERRAAAARNYLITLGIAPERLKTVSYGKEFPFDPGKTEEAYAKNRRAHFVITAK